MLVLSCRCIFGFGRGFRVRFVDGSVQEGRRLGLMDLVGLWGFDLARVTELL